MHRLKVQEEVSFLVEPNDEILIQRSVQGDGQAFVELVKRYEQPLATLIRYHINDIHDAEDVFQETLLHAWIGLRRLRDPKKIRAWLLRIARNRCHDFHKSSQRRDLPTEERELEKHVNQFGRVLAQQRDSRADIVEALEEAPASERDAAKLFYLQGLTIAEIAERSRCPEGTVKRRLHHARNYIRRSLGITYGMQRRIEMAKHKPGSKRQPFPVRRPEIIITESQIKPFSVDFRELPWWFGIPEVGDRTLWSIYDPPDWRIISVTDMQAVRPAKIHDLDCVEINVDVWEPKTGWMPSYCTDYGRLTDDSVQWLAISQIRDGRRMFRTFLDEDFNEDWAPMVRRMEDRSRFVLQEDGSFKQRCHSPEVIGAGMFSVKVGERSFICLRVLDVEDKPTERDMLMEAYLTQEGRTVLCRRYNGRLWKVEEGKPTWDEKFPEHNRIVIDGVTFVHWYDCLTGLALGFDESYKEL